MGMCCAVWQVAEDTVKDLIDDPSIGEEVIDELYEYNDELSDGEKIFLDLDKAWDGILFLLGRGKFDLPDKFLTSAGQEIPAVDQGYGAARYFNPREVAKLGKVLQKIEFSKLQADFHVADLCAAEVYPYSPDESDTETFEYLEVHWHALVEFFEATAARGRGLLTYIY